MRPPWSGPHGWMRFEKLYVTKKLVEWQSGGFLGSVPLKIDCKPFESGALVSMRIQPISSQTVAGEESSFLRRSSLACRVWTEEGSSSPLRT